MVPLIIETWLEARPDLGDIQPGAEQCRDPGQAGGPRDEAGGDGEGESGGDDERETPPRYPAPPALQPALHSEWS